MKKAAATIVAALLLATAACGGGGGSGDSSIRLSTDEQKVADHIASQLTGDGPAKLTDKEAHCFADRFVGVAGVPALKKSKLLDADGKVQTTGATFDRKLSEKYADSFLACVNFSEEVARSFAAADRGLDEKALASCLDKSLSRATIRQVIIDTRSAKTAESKTVSEANDTVLRCQQKAQKSTQKPAQKSPKKKDRKK